MRNDIIVGVLAFNVACTGTTTPEVPTQTTEDPGIDVVQTLHDYLVGTFDSTEQAASNLSYFEIQLVTCDVEAPELGDTVVYVEQAVLKTVDQPYRQRLYVVEAGDEPLQGRTEVYALVDEADAIGLCDRDEVVTFAPADVELREGCGVVVDWEEDRSRFVGGTEGTQCSSSLSGASYATSEVLLRANRIDSWDRGYDDTDSQVWGAVDGPYEFRRQ
ncbi:MAG: chromophore lyase CpcT/CpeT [Myxococcales bacterium]|nr:chromophore lyase CpcT/CpeT [Myxococcales bacterium]